ncbi:hypothetical protein ACLB90_00970 [Stenotrophomonas sp. LGBM10]|uniref:hypothetical protein n=1 Tax=Stenotrophomonas sp. LGBM10 TaxID=3390038 RepID=UPI00398BB28D
MAVVVVAALAAWRMTTGTGTEEPIGYSLPPESSADATAVPAPDAGGATIVDAAPAPADAASGTASAATGAGNDAADPATPAAGAAVATATAAGTAASSARPAAPAASGAAIARTARDKSKGDENLLGTLLGIIKEEDKPKAKAKAQAKPESMDALIAQIQADERQQDADANTAFDSIGGKKSTASTSSNIQSQLRRCPGANTLKGIDCRRKVCAAVLGKDPACPAM